MWLVATLLFVLAAVLCLTVVLLPVGLLLGFASLRFYGFGIKLMMPRSRGVEGGVRNEFRRWRRKRPIRAVRQSTKAGRKRLRRLGRQLSRSDVPWSR